MIKYAEVYRGVVRHVGTAPKLPEFAHPYEAIDITGDNGEIKVGMSYQPGGFITEDEMRRGFTVDVPETRIDNLPGQRPSERLADQLGRSSDRRQV